MKRILIPACIFLLTCSSTFYYVKLPVIGEVPVLVDDSLDFVPTIYYEAIWNASAEFGVPAVYLARLLWEESKFKKDAVYKNKNGTIDSGIAQLNSDYIEEFGWRYGFGEIDPFDPFLSIRVAAKHLSVLYANVCAIDDETRWYLTMCAYNCGLSKTRRMEVPSKTTAYARRIIEGGI